MQKNLLAKENAVILRGVAIISIAFHNYLHKPIFGFSQENEVFFLKKKLILL